MKEDVQNNSPTVMFRGTPYLCLLKRFIPTTPGKNILKHFCLKM